MATPKETRPNDNHESQSLNPRGQQLRAAAPLDAPPLQDEKADDHHDRNRLDVAGKRSNQFAAVLANHDGHRGRSSASGQPIAPPHNKSRVFPECAPRKIVLPATARNGRAKFGHGRSAEKRVESADHPDSKEQINIRQPLRDVARRTNNSGRNRVTDRGGYAEPHAENFQEAATASGSSRGVKSAARRRGAGRGR